MIDGLKLTISGEELRTLLEERIADHDRSAEHWRREQTRTQEDETEDAPLLPEHMCGNEEERHVWRAEVLGFIRDHIAAQETYRLGAADLEFGELLPAKPGWIEQDEYEERRAVGFQLERLTKRVGELTYGALCARAPSHDEPSERCTVTRVDVEGGPELIRIDRTDGVE
jgi:hypothetical protein